MNRTAFGAALLGALALGAAWPQSSWELELATPAPADRRRPERLEDADAFSCALCHAEIAAEWATTLHALAWEDPVYRAELRGKRKPESCHGCHAPARLIDAPTVPRRPDARDGEREPRRLGVSCKTCHLAADGTVHGPWGVETDAHRSEKDPRFVGAGANELCLACHATTIGPVIGLGRDFEDARLGERGMSCVGCHMAPVVRSHGTDEDEHPAPERVGRSHLLQTPRDPAFLAQAFELDARIEGARTVVRVRNLAGHRVPGLVERRLVLSLEALDAEGQVRAEREHTIDARRYLPVEGQLELELGYAAARVRVEGVHFPPGSRKKGIPFLALELAPDAGQ